jgi:glycosyltransferase involved in cell wall biosynthesis
MEQSISLDYLGDLQIKNHWYHRIKERYYRYIHRKQYLTNRNPSVVKNFAKQIKYRLPQDTDIIFSPSSIPIAQLYIDKPIVFYTDANFACMLNYYPSDSNYCNETIKDAHKMEKMALDRCQLAIYASDWAAQSAIDYYKVDPVKIAVIPFGANIETNRTKYEINKIIDQKSYSKCKILFIGADWPRKNGNTAIEVVKQLNQRGLKTELSIVGSTPPVTADSTQPYIKQYGFIDKSTREGKNKIDTLFTEAHFLFVPSLAEAFGIVYCEANSFGVPSIATNTGGIPTIIKDNKNGMKFDINTKPAEYSSYIQRLFSNPSKYKELALSSFEEYQTRLNWNTTGAKIKSLFENLL